MNTSSQTAEVPDVQPAWKQEVNARLSAHRRRRGAFDQPPLPGMEAPARAPRAARVAARVAERYAAAPSYQAILAAEAARAAEAAANAAREAQQAAEAVTEALRAAAESTSQTDPISESQPFELTPPPAPEPVHYRVDPASLPASRPRQFSPSLPHLHSTQPHSVDPHPHIIDPFEDALVDPAQPLPARVLEFPRELIASRKARPRIAEGPLREAGSPPEQEQLRIFEVEPEAISHQPVPSNEALVPEWCSIRLDPTPRHADVEVSGSAAALSGESQLLSSRAHRSSARASDSVSLLAGMLPLHVAPLTDRLLAALVDTCLASIAFLCFVAVFVACTAHPPSGKPAIVAAAATLVGFFLLYQWLFFTFAEATPGMRYARIALCTFDDENPNRKSLQRRVGAACLAALPLGLGFLWALLDDDRLGWHDRMTRTYQRSYR